MADMGEVKSPTAGRWTTTLVGAPITGLFGIFAAKVLDQLGWLDKPASETAKLLRASVESALVANCIGFLVFALLYGFLLRRAWRPVHVYDTERGERVVVSDIVEAEIIPARNATDPELLPPYLGRIDVSGSLSQGMMMLTIRGHSTEHLDVARVVGVIQVRMPDGGYRSLSPPGHLNAGTDAQPHDEYFVILEQPLYHDITWLRELFDTAGQIELNLNSLEVWFEAVDDRNKRARLSLWQLLIVRNPEDFEGRQGWDETVIPR